MRRLAATMLGAVFVGGLIFALLNYQLIIDYGVASQYRPTSSVTELAGQVQFSQRGDFLFRATRAKLDNPEEFNRHCHKKDEQTIVLGCYIGPQQIYIYDVADSRLNGVKQVTAAHEMLHAAYDRLPISERERVNRLVDQALPGVMGTTDELAGRLKLYQKTEPGERYNELHSILGTEAANLPHELEEYYRQYFKDRQIITNFAASYGKVFSDLKANQAALVSQLKALNDEISHLSDSYNAKLENLNGDIEAFNARAASQNGFSSEAEFNAARNSLLAARDSLEADRQTVNQKVSLYNQKRAELEALNVQVEDLNSKLDSTKLPSL